MENTTNLKQITFKELKHISDSNFEKYNRNVNVKNLKKFYGFHNQHKMIVEKLMEHNHFMGEPIESHVRCFIYTTKDNVTNGSIDISIPSIRMIQDMSWDQYNSLVGVDMELSTDTDVL